MNIFLKKINKTFLRISLFIIFFYFGFLKIFNLSEADFIISELLNKSFSFVDFKYFFFFFGLFECLIGVLFLIPKLDKFTTKIFFIHIIATFGPLFLLPEIAWQKPFIPTLEGQYIIKNLALISMVINLIILKEKN